MQLLDAGADPEISNNSRDSPLDLAAERGQVEVFECLLNRAVRHTDSRSVANMRITLEEYIAGGHLKSATDYIQSLPKTRYLSFYMLTFNILLHYCMVALQYT